MKRTPLPTATVGPNMAAIVQAMSSFFLPRNVMAPPGALGGSGGRRTVLTSTDPYASTVNGKTGDVVVSQQVTKAMVGGSVSWIFPTPFDANPVITAIPFGAPTATPAGLYIFALDGESVTIKSELASDTRTVHITAVTQT